MVSCFTQREVRFLLDGTQCSFSCISCAVPGRGSLQGCVGDVRLTSQKPLLSPYRRKYASLLNGSELPVYRQRGPSASQFSAHRGVKR